MKVFMHQTHHSIADFEGVMQYLKTNFNSETPAGIHLFPELFLTGYPLQDLCLQKEFISNYLLLQDKINAWAKKAIISDKILLLMGGLHYTFDANGLQSSIENVIWSLQKGSNLEIQYTKNLLPNYDIFDERKYFTPAIESKIMEWNGKQLALLLCEDMWPSSAYQHDPVEELTKINQDIDLVVNLSASPFHLGKLDKRVARAQEISYQLKAPMVYTNRIGGEDEILFDGVSFAVNGKELLCQGKLYQQDLIEFNLPTGPKENKNIEKVTSNTWESLFNPHLNQARPPQLHDLSDHDCEMIIQSLKFGIQEYATKCGFSRFLVASSGGIDSAVVLTIMRMVLQEGQSVESLFMPGHFSSPLSFDLAYNLSEKLGIKHTTIPIKFFHSAIKNSFTDNFKEELVDIADENIQSRLRGSLLFARSNQTNAMVINTSNKSELAVGYSTLYGDSVGAISILGDLYKSEVYALARYINKKHKEIIPQEIITREPTAELKKDQIDSDNLPPYERLDAMLEGLLSYRLNRSELIELGFDRDEVEEVYKLYTKSEFKRFQFCPIIKLRAKSFGFGYRVPICKRTN